jgi:CHAT domain-containing protein/tetratricopeptide (TPR) repeat protein
VYVVKKSIKMSIVKLLVMLVICMTLLLPVMARADDLQEADRLNREVVAMMNQGKFKEALPYAEQARAFCEKALGPESPKTATALDNLSYLYQQTGAREKTEPLLLRALAIREKKLEQNHTDTARSLNNLAHYHRERGDFDKAEPLFLRALKIYEQTGGPDKLDTAVVVWNLAELYNKKGVNDKAEQFYRRALTIYYKNLGGRHKNVEGAVYRLFQFYMKTGNYKKAEALVTEFLAFREKELGKEHADTVNTLHLLYSVYETQGNYGKAEPVFKRIVAMVEKKHGPEHPQTALYLNNLAMLYFRMGDYDRTELLLKRALAIREKVLGPEHRDTAQSLGDLATLYATIGLNDRAEQLYKRDLAVLEKILGPEHPDTAITMSNLGTFYRSIGLYDQAYPYYQRSLAVIEKVNGPDHPKTATMLANLAGLYAAIGNYDRAKPLLERSLEIRQKTLGMEHPQTASALGILAFVYMKEGDAGQAETLYKKALAIKEKKLGEKHPETAAVMNDLALLYAASGRSRDALSLMERVQSVDRDQIDQIMGFASEDQQRQFLKESNSNLDRYFSLIYRYFPNDADAASSAMRYWLARKGLLLETQQRIQDYLAHSASPQAREVFSRLVGTRQELASLVLAGAGAEGPGAGQKRMAELNAQKEDLEAQLSRLSKTYARKRLSWYANRVFGINAILPRASVLVDIAKFRDYDFKTGKWLKERYLAFILAPAKFAVVSLVDLGEAGAVDEKVALLKRDIKDTSLPRESLLKQSTALYRLVFAPLKKAIGDAGQIFVSPDGSLNLIPFEVLTDDDGRFLIDAYKFDYLSAGRDITVFGLEKETGRRYVLIGDPDFDVAAKAPERNAAAMSGRSRSLQGVTFSRLPGTREEVKTIGAILGPANCDIYLGKDARESVLQGKESPQILHLATHGFFLSDQDWSSLLSAKESRGIAIIEHDRPVRQKMTRIENPLLRSGLAMAGANRSLASEGASEGILTSDKILGLNLAGTELVVLSACETGVGEVRSGEGVYGLRRAFTQAGAKRLVMSMWEVPDRETKELMVDFYRNMLKETNYAEALRQAVLKQRAIVKKRYGYDHPYYWGAFVFLGDPM